MGVLATEVRAWGLGTHKGKDAPGGPSGLESLLAAGEERRLADAADRAISSGDLQELRALWSPSGSVD